MSDHCTLFPEGWWGDCCRKHDLDYESGVDRLTADQKLLQCVIESSPETLPDYTLVCGGASLVIGFIMFIGVRLFGSFFFKK